MVDDATIRAIRQRIWDAHAYILSTNREDSDVAEDLTCAVETLGGALLMLVDAIAGDEPKSMLDAAYLDLVLEEAKKT